MYLLDTNHCIGLLRNDIGIVDRLGTTGPHRLATCAIVAGELRYMAQRSDRPQSNQSRVDHLLQQLPVLPLTSATSLEFANAKAMVLNRFGPQERAKRRRFNIGTLGISDADLWIAACAAEHSLVVVSSDGDFRRIAEATGIATESWIDPT